MQIIIPNDPETQSSAPEKGLCKGVQPINQIGTPLEIVKDFGGKPAYEQAIRELEAELYSEVI